MAIKFGDAIFYWLGDTKGLKRSTTEAVGVADKGGGRIAGAFKKHQRQIGMAMTAIGGAIVGGIAAAVNKAADFEQVITNAASVTGLAGKEFEDARDKMEKMAKTLGMTTVFSATEAAGAMYDLASKGFEPAKMKLEELKPILDFAAATQTDLKYATELTTGALKGFNMENEDLGRIADVMTAAIGKSASTAEKFGASMSYISTTAEAANLSFEETIAALSQLYDANMDGSQAATALRMATAKLISPNEQFKEILERLKLTEEDVSLKSKTLAEVLRTLKTAGFNVADAMKVFDVRAGPAIIRLGQFSEEGFTAIDRLKAFTEALHESGGKAHEIAQLQLNTLRGQLRLLSSAIEAIVLPIGKALIPELTKLATGAAEVAQKIGGWLELHPDWTAAIVKMGLVLGGLIGVAGVMTWAGFLGAGAAGVGLLGVAGVIAVCIGGIILFRKEILALAEKEIPYTTAAIKGIVEQVRIAVEGWAKLVGGIEASEKAWESLIETLKKPGLERLFEWPGQLQDITRKPQTDVYPYPPLIKSRGGAKRGIPERAPVPAMATGGGGIHINEVKIVMNAEGDGRDADRIIREVAHAMKDIQRFGLTGDLEPAY